MLNHPALRVMLAASALLACTAEETTETTSSSGVSLETSDCEHTGFTAVAEDAGPFFGAFRYIAQSTLGEPVDVLSFELISEQGGATAAGTYSLTDDDYASCGNCVVIFQGCDGDLAHCDRTFLAQSGTLVISSFGASGEDFSGTISDIILAEVTIEEDLSSTVVPEGQTWCIDSFSFVTEVQ
jgi:hypothetical protein